MEVDLTTAEIEVALEELASRLKVHRDLLMLTTTDQAVYATVNTPRFSRLAMTVRETLWHNQETKHIPHPCLLLMSTRFSM